MLKYLDDSPQKSEPEDELLSAVETQAADDNWLLELDDVAGQVEEESLPESEPVVSSVTEEDQVTALKQKITGLEHRIGYLERIVKVSQILNSTLSLGPLLQIIVQSATELTGTERCSIMLFDKNTRELRFAEFTGGASDTMKKVSVPLDGSIAGAVVRSNRPLLIRDAKNDPRWHPNVDAVTDFETQSILGVPLRVRDTVIGVLEVVNKRSEEGFNQDDIQISETLSAHAAIAIENARLLDELQQAYRDLSEIDRIKGDFVSIASHELRTPLAVILGYATFLKDNVTGQASEQVDIVLNSAMQLRALIDDMVNLRHIQTDDVPMERNMFSLRQLVLDVIKEFADFAQAKNQVLTTKFIPNDLPLNIEADRQKIHLVLANLISNANKFTGEGGRIHINVALKGHEYWINVIDTGVGIPESEYNRIFDQFYQVESALTRKYEGMGLGLSITKGMVEVHKGRIWVESVVGKGSNFAVVFPTAPDVAT